MGSLRGNEIQQIYVCSQLIQCLKLLEKEGLIANGKQVLVVPSGNPYSMNIQKRFWPTDNTDINRMFPGYDKGETTQRIADGIFRAIQDYENGIQLTSFYMPGDFMPHVRMMTTGRENVELSKRFGLPYVVLRETRPYDTTTLNYNWQIWESNAFSLYTTVTSRIDKERYLIHARVMCWKTFMRLQQVPFSFSIRTLLCTKRQPCLRLLNRNRRN